MQEEIHAAIMSETTNTYPLLEFLTEKTNHKDTINHLSVIEKDISQLKLTKDAFPLLTTKEAIHQTTLLSVYLQKEDNKPGANERRLEIINYTLYARQLDLILTELTRTECATCPYDELGCCQESNYHQLRNLEFPVPDYDTQELQNIFWRLQEIENTFENHGDICKYHSNIGCSLNLTKSPLCLLDICDHLQEYVCEEYCGSNFLNSMKETPRLLGGTRKIMQLQMQNTIVEGIIICQGYKPEGRVSKINERLDNGY